MNVTPKRSPARASVLRILRGLRADIRSALKSRSQRGGAHSRSIRPGLCALLVFCATVFLLSVSVLFWSDALPLPAQPALRNDFLPSTRGRAPLGVDKDIDADRLHIAMIFDENRFNFSQSVLRSIMHYAQDPVTLHLVAPRALHAQLLELPDALAGDAHVVAHDYALCEAPTSLISFIARDIHMSAMCKVFLAEIVPSDHVLYVDSDVTVVSDIAHCWLKRRMPDGITMGTALDGQAVIGMGVDMGEICQSLPDKCYPIGMRFRIPAGLECGTTPMRAKIVRTEGRLCSSAGDYEPYQFNGGVALMNLQRMRATRFTARFVQASVYTWRQMDYRQAGWGEQDLLNSYFRLYPKAIVNLPCGCNFQYSAPRRESKCGKQKVAIAHGWTRQLLDTKSHDVFNLHFNYFRRSDVDYTNRDNLEPPLVPALSRVAPDWTPPPPTDGVPLDAALRTHDPSCSQQSHHCAVDDITRARELPIGILSDEVNVLSRTSRRPMFFEEMAESVREQTHPRMRHIVGTDDAQSHATYLQKHTNDVVLFSRPTQPFDASEVCKRCVSPSGVCGSAPGLHLPKARQRYLDCYCATAYPMNAYMNELHNRVRSGWVVYVDDDNLLQHRFAISEFLATVKSRGSLVAFRSHLGRLTPSDGNFANQIVMGDFDSSNFAFHSDNIKLATWVPRRCGDFRVARALAAQLPVEWVDRAFIQANPMRAAIGGLGNRTDRTDAAITVIITSYLSTGWRPRWVREIVDEYTKPAMRHLIAKVILVWNNPEEEVPRNLADAENDRFLILRTERNSLNNRWINVLDSIDTDVVLNLDDDIYVKREGLLCLLNWFRRYPRQIVGPFVRRVQGTKYVLDELTDSSSYSLVLPRVLLLPTTLLREYASAENKWFHDYVDTQEAHCDDVFMNIVAQNKAGVAPLRVLLPAKSVIDFYSKCYSISKQLTGGLALQKKRTEKRSECVHEMMSRFNLHNLLASARVATCLPRGNALEADSVVDASEYKAMVDDSFSCEGKDP